MAPPVVMAPTLNLLSAEPTKPPPVGDQERERDFSSCSNPSLKGTVTLQNKCQQYTKHRYKQVVRILQINHVLDFVELSHRRDPAKHTKIK